MPSFASRLRELRAAAGITQKSLAERIGVTVRAIQNLESGRNSPTLDTAIQIARTLGYELDVFRDVDPGAAPPARRHRGRPLGTHSKTEPAPVPATQKATPRARKPKAGSGQDAKPASGKRKKGGQP